MRILIVDDEVNIRKAMRKLLADHDIEEATNVAEAKGQLTNGSAFDLVISDVMMPGGTGVDLHRWLVERDDAMAGRLIFVTGGMRDDAREYIDRCGAPVVDKPFSISELKNAVEGFVS
jgi:DNA-binding response OmpR family regulator